MVVQVMRSMMNSSDRIVWGECVLRCLMFFFVSCSHLINLSFLLLSPIVYLLLSLVPVSFVETPPCRLFHSL